MSIQVTVAVVAGIVAVSVASFNAFAVRRGVRRDRTRLVYSNALCAVARYQNLPEWISRRASAGPDTVGAIADRILEIEAELSLSEAKIALESAVVDRAYQNLVATVRKELEPYIPDPWRTKVPRSLEATSLAEDACRRKMGD